MTRRPRHLRVVRDERDTATRDHLRRHDLYRAALRAVTAAVMELRDSDADTGMRLHDDFARLLSRDLERRRPR